MIFSHLPLRFAASLIVAIPGAALAQTASAAAPIAPVPALPAGGVAGASSGVTSPAPVSNGKFILAAPSGASAEVGSFPANLLPVDGGRYVVVTDTGYRESLSSIDTATGRVVSAVDFNYKPASVHKLSHHNRKGGPGLGAAPGAGAAALPQNGVNGTPGVQDQADGLYYGLAAAGNTVYAALGAKGKIAVLHIGADGTLTRADAISARPGDFVAGLATDGRGYLYAVNNEYYNTQDQDDPRDLTTPGSLSIYKTSTGGEVARLALGSLKIPAGPLGVLQPDSYPLAVAALTGGAKCYVTSERDGVVYAIDTREPAAPKLLNAIKTGSHPSYLLLDGSQAHLYVANADADTVSVIDTATDGVARTILLRPAAAQGLPGVSPMGMALSTSGQTLYVALGDMNAVAAVRAADGDVLGYLPAGWYPTSVAAASGRLLIASAKGSVPRIPNDQDVLTSGSQRHYVLNIIEGTVQTRPLPTPADLARGTRQVIADNRYAALSASAAGSAMLKRVGRGAGKITHIVYIIKENRTYDQILGDLPEGNGDPSLVMFGRNVTPNQHALAERFVLLDNFYDSGDVSGDGWTWSTQSYANENVARNIPYNYSGRGRNYDVEGQNNGYITGGFPALDPDGKPLSSVFPKGAPPIPDVSQNPGGYIWDDVHRAGLSLHNFGFFLSDGVKGVLPDNYPTKPGLQPAGHDLHGVTDIDFRQFDLDYPDSNAPSYYAAHDSDLDALYKKTAYGKYDAPSRYAEWQRVFDQMIAADPTGTSVPNLMTVRFMTDHTSSMKSGEHSPESDVADNDYAVGELVEHISRSPIWPHTAIFVIEDDAQNGQDHVDAHRSTCYVISPYIKQSSVDHTFYNTDSVLRTMEGLLGAHPMSQYDGVATPILDFTPTPENAAPFASILPPEALVAERNPSRDELSLADPRRPLVLASDKMDWVHPDSQSADLVNVINWKSVHGASSNPPPPVHTVIVAAGATTISTFTGKPEADDDDAPAVPHTMKAKAVKAHDDDDD